ncbi:DUF4062 domain-containing protein [Flavivirga abyssicola]|uniref:DUF4062 domain-containing protein n=1 Tax=Flavivirga abyssicola TaxID=3063533 RepID=UPI0026DF2DB1|nr:DUF4062 domain-containing protein [Flavivirga sp. MEBiC07777]WVK14179.1 DUF4062 domain-containing protein [Flavivirga sp. MEBiC07777]
MGTRRYSIFVSSTYKDLKKERAAILKAIINMKHIPVGMELFRASDNSQWEVIKKQINRCDYYALIISDKYGSVDENGTSYTEREFDYAEEIGKPILSFVRSEKAIKKLPNENRYIEKTYINELKNFRRKALANRMCEIWNKKYDLSTKFMHSLMDEIEANPQIGWVRADEKSPEYNFILEENRKLSNDYRGLVNFNDELKRCSPLSIYKNFDHAWFDIEKLLEKLVIECREQDEKLKIRAMGLCLHKSFPKVSDFLIQNYKKDKNKISNVRIEMRLQTLDPNCSSWKLLDRRWPNLLESFNNDRDDLIDFFEEMRKEKKDNDMFIKHTQYTHMPNFHGLLINDTDLFLSDCAWDSKKKLTAGKNFYEHYKAGIGEIHDHKIKLYKRWFDYGRYNGSTARDKAVLYDAKNQ